MTAADAERMLEFEFEPLASGSESELMVTSLICTLDDAELTMELVCIADLVVEELELEVVVCTLVLAIVLATVCLDLDLDIDVDAGVATAAVEVVS